MRAASKRVPRAAVSTSHHWRAAEASPGAAASRTIDDRDRFDA